MKNEVKTNIAEMIESQIVSYLETEVEGKSVIVIDISINALKREILCHYEVDELAKKIKIIYQIAKNSIIFVNNLKN